MSEHPIPSSGDVREFLRRNEMTGSAAARIVGVDSRTVRKWTAYEDASNRRAIPWSAWILLRLYAGEIELDDFRRMVMHDAGISER